MADTRVVQENPRSVRRAIPHLRWWIALVLFASTTINYLDRQTLSLLAPFLKVQYHWTNTDYAYIVVAFRVAYTIGQTVLGRLVDRLGTRRGLSFKSSATSSSVGSRPVVSRSFISARRM